MNKRSITIICPYGTQLFDKFDTTPYGGAEFRTHKIAKTLSDSNLFENINVVVHKNIQSIEIDKIDGINVIKSNILNKNLFKLIKIYLEIRQIFFDFIIITFRLIKFNYKKFNKFHTFRKYIVRSIQIFGGVIWYIKSQILWRNIFNKTNNDILFLFGVSTYNYFIFKIAKNKFKKIILFSTSDTNFSDKSLKTNKISKRNSAIVAWLISGYPSERDEYGSFYKHHNYLLSQVENIVVQNKYQKNRVETYLSKKKNIELFCPFNLNEKKELEYDYIWIGKFDKIKKVEILFESLINKDLKINIFTNSIRPEFDNFEIFNNPNIKLFKHASKKVINSCLSRSKFLINTSNFEGFPNTFLDAFSFGVPVLSLNVDPNNIIQNHNLGYFFNSNLNNFKVFINQPSKYCTNYNDLSNNCKEYLESNHNEKKFVKLLEEFI